MRAAITATVMSVVAFSATGAAQAPGADSSDPALTLNVSPARVPPGGTITISGRTYPQPGMQVVATVTPPGGSPTSLSAMPDTSGSYRIVFSGARAPGAYKVTAQAGPKGAAAVGQFTVQQTLIDVQGLVGEEQGVLEQPEELVKEVQQQVDNVPDSPAKSQMESKLAEVSAAVAPLATQAPKLAEALQPYQDLVSRNPAVEDALQEMFDHLAQLDEEEKQAREKFDKEIAESRKALQTCDAIDQATQALRAVPEMLMIARRPWEFAVAWATNMAKSELPPEAENGAQAVGDLAKKLPAAVGDPKRTLAENELTLGSETEIAQKLVARIPESVRATPGYRFAVTETRRFVPRIVGGVKGPLGMFDRASLLAEDLAGYANEQLFAQYCQKFEGKFTATMLAHFYSKPNGMGKPTEWWTYSTAIAGKLVLRYPREAAGKAVALSGQLEGGATRFTYNENAFSTDLFGSMAKGGTVYVKDTPPAATDNAQGGMVNSMLSPTSFYIPLTGQYGDGKITMEMGDSRTDFNATYTMANTFYAVIAPTTLMIPILGHFSLPYKDAHFILDHVVKGDYPVATKGNVLVIEKKVRQEFPANQNLAVYTIDMTACNPGCP